MGEMPHPAGSLRLPGGMAIAGRAWPAAARLLTLLAVAGWAAVWGWLSLDLVASHVEYNPSPAQVWLFGVFRFHREGVDAVRYAVLGVLPAALLLWAARPGAAQWIAPARWRPALLLAGWVAALSLPAGISALLVRTGAIGCVRAPGGAYAPCEEAGDALHLALRLVILCALLAVLWRRSGGVHGMDAGALAAFAVGGICVLSAAGEVYATAARMLGGWAYVPVVETAQWLAVLALAVLVDRWLAHRPPAPQRWRMRVAIACAAAFFGFALFADHPYGLLFVVTCLLSLATLLHALWWSARPSAAG